MVWLNYYTVLYSTTEAIQGSGRSLRLERIAEVKIILSRTRPHIILSYYWDSFGIANFFNNDNVWM